MKILAYNIAFEVIKKGVNFTTGCVGVINRWLENKIPFIQVPFRIKDVLLETYREEIDAIVPR